MELRLSAMRFGADGEWEAAPAPTAPHPGRSLRLLTWNIYFGGHQFEERRDALFAHLERLDPDVVALQEVIPELLTPLLEQEWVRRRYHVGLQLDDHYEPIGRYGVILLSRVPVERLWQVELPTGMERALLCARLANGLTVGTVHLESLGERDYRVLQLAIIQPRLLDAGDAVLVGDMNFSDADRDETMTLDRRFTDVWKALRPGEPGFTVDTDLNLMRYQLKQRRAQKRIDRVLLAGPTWKATSISLVGTEPIHADGTFVSDHFGLLVELAR